MATSAIDSSTKTSFTPAAPTSIEDTGLGLGFLTDLALKVMYLEGDFLGYELADRMHLPHPGVVEEVLEALKREQLCEVKGTGAARSSPGLGRPVYRYSLTGKGRAMAREAMARCQYAGPAPVPLAQYNAGMEKQASRAISVDHDALDRALDHLVVDDHTKAHLGAAINSHRSMFLFGPPGDGKTVISESIGRLVLEGAVHIPYAVETGNEVIKVFDAVNHERLEEADQRRNHWDRRWILVRRPVIIAGGELILPELDLVFEPNSRYYEAPLQMKANGGMLIIDDFGRQQARPRDLLNRWIVPLERRMDFLTMHMGRKIEVPFDVLVVFATNIAPKELVDEAFLRRIRHKIRIEDPTWDEYREIFRRECRDAGVPYDDKSLAYLIKEQYIRHGRPVRRCHPRDLIAQVKDIAGYLEVHAVLSPDLLDKACDTYFVDL